MCPVVGLLSDVEGSVDALCADKWFSDVDISVAVEYISDVVPVLTDLCVCLPWISEDDGVIDEICDVGELDLAVEGVTDDGCADECVLAEDDTTDDNPFIVEWVSDEVCVSADT
eukprot:g18513.t1